MCSQGEQKRQKKIAILGGGYNPPTIAYEKLVKLALLKGGMDEVWLMPYRRRAFGKWLAARGEDRFVMAELLAKNLGSNVVACDLELKRRGKSFTVDTVRELREQYPDYQFSWLIGSDLLYELEDWKNIDDLKDIVTFICVVRPGYPIDKELIDYYGAKLLIGSKQMPDVSASEARRRVAQDLGISDLVPAYIYDFIKKNKLYKN